MKGIDGFIDEISELAPSPLTPHGRDCVRTILLAFAAHVKHQTRVEPIRSALAGLVGADGKEELEQMEAVMRAMPAPAQDKAVTIDAIHALIASLPNE